MLKDGENGVDGKSDPHNLTFSNDGSHIYVSGRTDNAIRRYERNASTVFFMTASIRMEKMDRYLTQPLDSVISSMAGTFMLQEMMIIPSAGLIETRPLER